VIFGAVNFALAIQGKMEISQIVLEGQHVSLEPLSAAHEESLIAAAGDEVHRHYRAFSRKLPAYIALAFNAQAQGLSFRS